MARTIASAFTRLATARHRAAHARVWLSDEGGNLFPANVITGTDTSSNTTGFTAVVGGAIASSVVAAWQGSRSLEITAANTSDGAKTNAISVAAGTDYTCSVWVKAAVGDGGKRVSVHVRDALNGTNGDSRVVRLREDRWTRVGAMHTMGAGAVTLEFHVLSTLNAVTVYADAFQCEAVEPATRWSSRASEWLVNLTSHVGKDWLRSVEWSDSTDAQLATATVRLQREFDQLSIMPGVTSRANRNGSTAEDILVEGRLLYVDVQIAPVGARANASGTWVEVFRGRVDSIDVGAEEDSTITLTCRDLAGQEIQDAWVEDDRPLHYDADTDWYDDISWPRDACDADGNGLAQDVMSGVLGPGVAPDMERSAAVVWALNEPAPSSPIVRAGPVLQLVRDGLAASIGDELRYRWNATAGAWVLTWQVADRTSVAVDITFDRDFYSIKSWRRSIVDVRNGVRVDYDNSADAWKRTTYYTEDTASQSLYGLRVAMLGMASNSNINTATEAEGLAADVLSELHEPRWQAQIDIPLYPWVELGDIVSLTGPNSYTSSSELRGSVVAISHSVGGGDVRTSLTLREVDVAGSELLTRTGRGWGRRMAGPGRAMPTSFNGGSGIHRARAYQAVGTSVAITNQAKIGFDTASYDIGGNFNLSTSRYVAPIDGTYQFTANIIFANNPGFPPAGTPFRVWVERSGTEVSGIGISATKAAAIAITVSGTAYMTAGQYLEVYAYNGDGASAHITDPGIAKTSFTVDIVR